MFKSMFQCCLDASENAFPMSNPEHCAILEWKTRIQPLNDDSLFWHWVWNQCGRPRFGVVVRIMHFTIGYGTSVADLELELWL